MLQIFQRILIISGRFVILQKVQLAVVIFIQIAEVVETEFAFQVVAAGLVWTVQLSELRYDSTFGVGLVDFLETVANVAVIAANGISDIWAHLSCKKLPRKRYTNALIA